jgi:hypothetical protein
MAALKGSVFAPWQEWRDARPYRRSLAGEARPTGAWSRGVARYALAIRRSDLRIQ